MDDIEEEDTSDILDVLDNSNVNKSVFLQFRQIVLSVSEYDTNTENEENEQDKDEWSILLNQLTKNKTFNSTIYKKSIKYFRKEAVCIFYFSIFCFYLFFELEPLFFFL